jgi:hypothetical protein
MRTWLLILIAAASASACGDNLTRVVVDARDQLDGEIAPDAPPASTFTRFVIDQILNNTSDTAEPVPFATFQVLPDPDLDDTDYSAYQELFP